MTKMLALTATFLAFAVAAAAAVPDPTRSTVAPCFATCPAGDLAFSAVVRDFAGNDIAGSSVVIDFSACPAVNICSNQEPGTTVLSGNKVLRTTDSTGTVI